VTKGNRRCFNSLSDPGRYTALFAAGQMLGELAALDGESALRRCLHCYDSLEVLVIDEMGHL
jgi:hypothetical protein